MVEVDIQFLGGVAITVFLAMLFFGVVVLWDIALALRSVGDKIDKLEDNIDDDLTDIGHSLDNMANAPGGGGGTQLHLSGGTISSGPSANQQGVQSGQQGAPAHAGSESAPPGGQQYGPPEHGSPEASRHSPDDSREDQASAASADAETASAAESNGATPEPNETDEPRERDGADESDGKDEPGDGFVEHPRAAASRGRFITSPDRTAWYATPLDHDAMATAGPTIAGELEAAGTSNDDSASGDDDNDGGDDDEVIATGPAEVSEEEEEEPIVAGAAGDDGTIDEDDSPGDERSDGERSDERDSNDARDGSEPTGENGSEPEEGADDASRIGAPDGFDFTGDENDDESDADDEVDAEEGDAEDVDAEVADEDVAVANEDESSSDGTGDVLTFDEGDETDLAPRRPGDERDSDDANEVALEPSPNESERGSDDTDAGEERTGERSDGAEEPPTAEDFTDFEFADADANDEEVTVDEAVDTMNDDAPSLSLSSHDFDVTAEYDDDGASLVFEFDPETIDISGSTKRLLRYQMRSFADQESTPDGEVRIRRNAIVIDIPAADGSAVQRWGEAAVAIIDRTLYLSDNSN